MPAPGRAALSRIIAVGTIFAATALQPVWADPLIFQDPNSTLTISGLLKIDGTSWVPSTGTLIVNNHLWHEGVAFNNSGTTTLKAGSRLTNYGYSSFNNTGKLNFLAGSNLHNSEIRGTAGDYWRVEGILNNNDGGVIDLGINLTFDSDRAGTVNMNAGSTLNVLSGVVLTNKADYTYGNPYYHEQINSGTLNIFAGATLANLSGWDHDFDMPGYHGYMLNYGLIKLHAGSVISNSGYFDNFGVLDLGADLTLGEFERGFGSLGLNYGSQLIVRAGATLTNTANPSYHPSFSFGPHIQTNKGLITNFGSIINTGTFDNSVGVIEIENAGVFNNAGMFVNSNGVVEIKSVGVFSNGGTLDNSYGVITNAGSLKFSAGSTFDNTGGVLNNNTGGVIDLGISLALGSDDAGTVNMNAGSTLNVLSGVTLSNQADHVQTNQGTLNIAGTLNNTGTLNNNAIIVNNSTLNNSGLLALKAGSSFDNTGGVLNNNAGGVIDLGVNLALGNAAAGTLNLNTGGTLNVLTGVTLTNQAGHTQSNLGTLNNDGTLANMGALESAGLLRNTWQIINTGRLTLLAGSSFNNTGGHLSNMAGGVIELGIDLTLGSVAGGSIFLDADGQLDVLAGGKLSTKDGFGLTSKLSNAGTFDNGALFNSGELSNAGTLNNTGTMNYGTEATVQNSGTFNNHGALNFGIIEDSPVIVDPPFCDVCIIPITPINTVTTHLENSGTFNNHGAIIHNGTIQNSGIFNIAAGGSLNGTGTYIQSAGALNVDGVMTLTGIPDTPIPLPGDPVSGTGSIVINGGTLGGSGTINANVAVNGGTVGPGNSPGHLSIDGDYFQDSLSTLSFELAGTEQGDSYDWLDVSGTATLGGELELLWYDGFEAGLGDSFDLFTAESFSGDFDLLSLAILGEGFTWDLSFLIDEVGTTDVLRLSVVSQVPVPAAAWLFGSALLGLVGIKRKK